MAAEGGKLAGIKVLDLSLFLPGPMLTVMMADHGAEVVKVEPPTGDPVREMEPFENGHSVWFANLNRGKKSVVCDLKSEAGKAKLWDFIADADVFVEAFRPVALGAGVKCEVFRTLAREGAGACSFHSITSSGISARKREGGL